MDDADVTAQPVITTDGTGGYVIVGADGATLTDDNNDPIQTISDADTARLLAGFHLEAGQEAVFTYTVTVKATGDYDNAYVGNNFRTYTGDPVDTVPSTWLDGCVPGDVPLTDCTRLLGEPTVTSDRVTATVTETQIRVVGEISGGETVEVEYTVDVNDFVTGGNHIVQNILAKTGEEPVCEAGSELCTTSAVTEPRPGTETEPPMVPEPGAPTDPESAAPPAVATGLVATGTEAPWGLMGISGVVILMFGGATILTARIVKRRVAQHTD